MFVGHDLEKGDVTLAAGSLTALYLLSDRSLQPIGSNTNERGGLAMRVAPCL